jgi:hypothetical protein
LQLDKYDDIARKVIDLIADEWIKQGHDLTGAFREKMGYEVERTMDTIRINIYDNTANSYGAILNKGVTADRIPFSPGSGAKTSKYIQGLVRYAKLRMGVDDKAALSIAFAIAYKHKAEGMPTAASSRFSQTGKRTQFVEDATKEIDEVVRELMTETVEAWL